MGIEHLSMDITLSLLWIAGFGLILVSAGTVFGFIMCAILKANEDPE